MARKALKDTATVDTTVAVDIEQDDKVVESKTVRVSTKKKAVEPLEDYDEIEVISLVPNVSYKDSKTNDMYEWDEVGHVEYMTFDTLKNMWRNHKGYFRNMLLKPNDERVINQFGLTKLYEKYDFLMNESNYTRVNVDKICDSISSAPNGLKRAICNKVKDMVVNGKVSNAFVIKTLERHLDLDLISFL